MRSFEDLDARNGMNRAPRSSRDLNARYFENQLMGSDQQSFLLFKKYSFTMNRVVFSMKKVEFGSGKSFFCHNKYSDANVFVPQPLRP
jgi:hypothetical protein